MTDLHTFNFNGHDVHVFHMNKQIWFVFDDFIKELCNGRGGISGLPDDTFYVTDWEEFSEDMTGSCEIISIYGLFLLTHLISKHDALALWFWLSTKVVSRMEHSLIAGKASNEDYGDALMFDDEGFTLTPNQELANELEQNRHILAVQSAFIAGVPRNLSLATPLVDL